MPISHITPVAGEPTRFWVPSSRPDHEPHIVDLDYEGAPACSCEDHMVRQHRCKHITAVLRFTGQPT